MLFLKQDIYSVPCACSAHCGARLARERGRPGRGQRPGGREGGAAADVYDLLDQREVGRLERVDDLACGVVARYQRQLVADQGAVGARPRARRGRPYATPRAST